MSDWRTHLRVGLISEFITITLLVSFFLIKGIEINLKEFIFLVPLLFISPLLPDIDHKSSKITNIGILVSVLAIWVFHYFNISSFVYPLVAVSIILILSNFSKHRGITHKWWLYSIIYIILILKTNMIILSVVSFVGVLSHLILDKEV